MLDDDYPTFNILLLGLTQTGKSTLLESFKRYADTTYRPNLTCIGSGSKSCTQHVRVDEVITNLPVYKPLVRQSQNQGIPGAFCDDPHTGFVDQSFCENVDSDIEDQDDEDLGVEVHSSGTATYRFRIFDTPGLHDTNEKDISHVASIIESLSGIDALHLILIADFHQLPLHPGDKEGLITYSQLFTEMGDLMLFIHTRIPNVPRNKLSKSIIRNLSERSELLNGIMGRVVPSKTIDCDLEEKDRTRNCLMLNKIREILAIATIKSPVQLGKLYVHKTRKMIDADDMIRMKYNNYFEAIEATCAVLDEAQRISFQVDDVKNRIRTVKQEISRHDTDELCTVYEDGFDQNWKVFYIISDVTMEYSNQEWTIAKKVSTQSKVALRNETGGEGNKEWSVTFRRNSFEQGYFHVILSTESRQKYRNEIEAWNSELRGLEWNLDTLNQRLGKSQQFLKVSPASSHQAPEDADYMIIQENLVTRRTNLRRMIDHSSSTTLDLPVFLELAKANVYQGSVMECAIALEGFWANKLGFDCKDL